MIITDKNKVDEVLRRGVENIYPNREALEKVLMSGKKIRLYCGFDPSASVLHIGNAIAMSKLAQFQKLGHEVIFLIGDFTGMIGDPSDKTSTRKKMTREEVLENSKEYQKQASGYLKFDGDNPSQVLYNSEWSDKLNFRDVIELASNFTLQQMINRKMFKRNLAIVKCRHCNHKWPAPMQLGSIKNLKSAKGIKTTCPNCGNTTWLDKSKIEEKETDQLRETPIGFHELLYPLAQGYDSVAMDVDLEIGGNDQTFNMLCGRDLMKAVKNKEKFVLTMKLLVDSSGKKMGKTEGNIVNLDESPENMYGQVMSWPDGVIEAGLELCTNLPMAEVKNFAAQIKNGLNPRDIKMRLAYEIVKINHGEKKAKAAEEHFIKTVQKKEMPDSIINYQLSITNWKIVDLLVEIKLAGSKGEARRLIKQGGIKIGGDVIKDTNKIIEVTAGGILLQKGKRGFVKVTKK